MSKQIPGYLGNAADEPEVHGVELCHYSDRYCQL